MTRDHMIMTAWQTHTRKDISVPVRYRYLQQNMEEYSKIENKMKIECP